MNNPCNDCEKKGCGAFHDKCEKHLNWKKSKQNEKGHTIYKEWIDRKSYMYKVQYSNNRRRKRNQNDGI